jgi:hypothetical protein
MRLANTMKIDFTISNNIHTLSKKDMYYIYHVPGIKIGCTENPDSRPKNQGYFEYQLLEAYENIYEASDREIYLQKLMGYPVDAVPYYISVENFKKATIAATNKLKGITYSDEHKKKISEAHLGMVLCKNENGTIEYVTQDEYDESPNLVGITANVKQPKLNKPIKCVEDDIVFASIREASTYYNLPCSNIVKNLKQILHNLGKRSIGRSLNFVYINKI